MNSPTSHNHKPLAGQYPQYPGARVSTEPEETFPQNRPQPASTGLANEARPGLGARASGHDHERTRVVEIDVADVEGLQSVVPRPPETRRDPVEQDSDSLAHQLERETGVSGHSGGS